MPKPKQSVAIVEGSYDLLCRTYYSDQAHVRFVEPKPRAEIQEQMRLDLDGRVPLAIRAANESTQGFNNAYQSAIQLPESLEKTVYAQGDWSARSVIQPKMQSMYYKPDFFTEGNLSKFDLRTLDNDDKPMGISIIWHPDRPEELFSITIGENMMDPDLTKRKMIVITPANIHQLLIQEAHPGTPQQNEATKITDTSFIQRALLKFCQHNDRVKPLLMAIFPEKKGIDFNILSALQEGCKLIQNPSKTTLSPETTLIFAEKFAPIQCKIDNIQKAFIEGGTTGENPLPLEIKVKDILHTMLMLSGGEYDSKLYQMCDSLCRRRINTFIARNYPNADTLEFPDVTRVIESITTQQDTLEYKKAITQLFYLLTDIGRRESNLTEQANQSPTPLLLSCMQLLFVLNKYQIDCSAIQKMIDNIMQQLEETGKPSWSVLNDAHNDLCNQTQDFINHLLTDGKIPETTKSALTHINNTLKETQLRPTQADQQAPKANMSQPDFSFSNNIPPQTAQQEVNKQEFTARQQAHRLGWRR